MNRKKRILFVGEGGSLAHIVRPLVLAQLLDPNRFEIHFACALWYKWLLDHSGFTYHPLPTMTRDDFRDHLSQGKPLYNRQTLEEYVPAELDLFKKVSPDLIIGDFRISLGISTELAKIPYASITNAFWSPHSTVKKIVPDLAYTKFTGRGLGQLIFNVAYPLVSKLSHSYGFNAVRKAYGLTPFKSLEEIYTYGEWTLFTDIPSLAPTTYLPEHQQYMGPILDMPQIEQPAWWQQWPTDKPIIYVGLGSTGNITLMENIVKALAQMDVTVLLATAQRIHLKEWPKNFYVAPYISGLEASKQSQLVLYNGGSGSVYQALSCGCPVLGFPTNMDQFLCMALIETKGAGKRIIGEHANIDNIKKNVQEILSTATFKHNAEKLAIEIKAYDVSKNFNQFIDSWDNGTLKRRF